MAYFRTTVRNGYHTVRLAKIYVNFRILTYMAKWDVPCMVFEPASSILWLLSTVSRGELFEFGSFLTGNLITFSIKISSKCSSKNLSAFCWLLSNIYLANISVSDFGKSPGKLPNSPSSWFLGFETSKVCSNSVKWNNSSVNNRLGWLFETFAF